jgi:hypothetical protein
MAPSPTKFEHGSTTKESFVTHARPRYWFCLGVHALVVVIYVGLALTRALGIDNRWTFDIKHLSEYTAILTFTTGM